MERRDERSDQVGVTMPRPFREDAHSTDRHNLQVLPWLIVPTMVNFPDAYGGKIASLHKYKLANRGKLNIP